MLFVALQVTFAGSIALTAASSRDFVAGVGSVMLGLAMSIPVTVASVRRPIMTICATAGTVLAVLLIPVSVQPKPLLFPELVYQTGALSLPWAVPISANALAYLLVPAPIAAVCLAVTETRGASRAYWAVVALTGLTVISLAGSRAALLGELVGLGLILVVAGICQRRRGLTIIAASVVLLTALLVGLLGDSRTLANRLSLWQRITANFDLVSGAGYGEFASYELRLPRLSMYEPNPLNAHNMYIQTLLDFGAVGLVALLTLLAYSMLVALNRLRCPRPHWSPNELCVSLLVVAAIPAMAVTGLFESIFSTAWHLTGGVTVTVISPLLVLVASAGIARSRPSS